MTAVISAIQRAHCHPATATLSATFIKRTPKPTHFNLPKAPRLRADERREVPVQPVLGEGREGAENVVRRQPDRDLGTAGERVAVVGWQLYESIEEIKAVRMVVESAW
jgi:hypothetical protein